MHYQHLRRIFRIPGEHGANPPPDVQPNESPKAETTAFGVGDTVQCGVSSRLGVIQLAYVDGRHVVYSVDWEDGSRSAKKASEIRLIRRKP